MAATRESIAIFYNLHHSKGKAYTYNHFKKSGKSKTIYDVMKQFDEMGSV